MIPTTRNTRNTLNRGNQAARNSISSASSLSSATDGSRASSPARSPSPHPHSPVAPGLNKFSDCPDSPSYVDMVTGSGSSSPVQALARNLKKKKKKKKNCAKSQRTIFARNFT
ncbi:hypothetical protein G6F56_001108 [Rhizopus delemar]|nr:hypothetical protein G6F56_001108 [Rhizopus delemar]